MPTMSELERMVAEDMQERAAYVVACEDDPRAKYAALAEWVDEYSDAAHEVADSTTPVYTGDLLQLAADNIALATDEPEVGPAFDGSPTPVNIIAANVYERLCEAAVVPLDEDEIHYAESADEVYMVAYDTAADFYHRAPDSPARVLAEAFAEYRPEPFAHIAAALIEAGDWSDGDAASTADEERAELLAAYAAGRAAEEYTPPALRRALSVAE